MIPYTYLIGWSWLQKFYYGCRYAKDCNPSDLWVKYFTSSKLVKVMRSEYGEPDIIQIRKVFSTKQECVKFENKVVRKLVTNPKFLNMNVAGAIVNGNPYPRTEKQIENCRALMTVLAKKLWYNNGTVTKKFEEGEAPSDWVRGRTKEYKHNLSLSISSSITGKVWFNNGYTRKKYYPGQQPSGWSRGWSINNRTV